MKLMKPHLLTPAPAAVFCGKKYCEHCEYDDFGDCKLFGTGLVAWVLNRKKSKFFSVKHQRCVACLEAEMRARKQLVKKAKIQSRS